MPVAGTLLEAIAIFELAKRHGVRMFSSSSTRFGEKISTAAQDPALGELTGATTNALFLSS
ncbi:MAG: hypothetical protein H7A53_09890 [Akkermansiaceae bacterium]|nr:hypothetical protein [Akkermansiaceae bacterium]